MQEFWFLILENAFCWIFPLQIEFFLTFWKKHFPDFSLENKLILLFSFLSREVRTLKIIFRSILSWTLIATSLKSSFMNWARCWSSFQDISANFLNEIIFFSEKPYVCQICDKGFARHVSSDTISLWYEYSFIFYACFRLLYGITRFVPELMSKRFI